jgi:glycosyltransferase involved in cell wall biosynthesis
MPRFAHLLLEGMRLRGHKVELWYPTPRCHGLAVAKSMKKWLGYIDQYVIFPYVVRNRLRDCSSDTLFVFTDHALGPWVPLVVHRPHIIHCHDFLAQRSANKEIVENQTGWTGRKYQLYIRHGYSQGKNFISVSNKTKQDLHDFIQIEPSVSEVVYNGLNPIFKPLNIYEARKRLHQKVGLDLSLGYLLHVGGNQWYKNRVGIIELYNAWRKVSELSLPMLFIGEKPDSALLQRHSQSPYKQDIHFIEGLDDESVRIAYAGASVFLFPSLAEGFGWPIAEAMASGCPVITTNEAPMTEVAGDAAFLIPRCPKLASGILEWATKSAVVLNNVLGLSDAERNAIIALGMSNAKRFNSNCFLDQVENIYQNIIQSFCKQ